MYGLNAGTKIAQFTLDQQLGQGGQGSVWRARADGQPVPVALKIIPVRGTPTTMVERVRREAEALMRLSHGHPSVVACQGVYEDPTLGVLAVAMELVEGVDLQAALRDPRCDGPARESILMHVARALGHLHDNGFVHRDIKPQNILIKHSFYQNQADPSSVKLVDFGIATPKGNPKPLTEVGTVIGTPAYMPPERIDPIFWQAAQGLPCEDVFSFGVIAYEALFGRHPAKVEDDGTLSVYAERYRAVERSGEPWPALPPDHRWSAALRGALALKVKERLPDGNAVARAASGGFVPAVSPGGGPRTEIGMPLHGLEGMPGIAPPGQTVSGAAAPFAPPPAAGMPAGMAAGMAAGIPAASAPWGAPGQPPGGWSPSVPAAVVPPAPAYVPRSQKSEGGGSNAIRLLMGLVGVFAIGVPAVVLAARFVGKKDDDHGPIVVPTETAAPTIAAPPPTAPMPTDTATAMPTFTAPPAYTPPPGNTQAPPGGGYKPPSTSPTSTTKPPSTVPTSTTNPGQGTPPKIGPGTQPTSPATTTTPPGGRPPPINLGKPPGGTPGGTPTTPPGGGGRPPPIKLGK